MVLVYQSIHNLLLCNHRRHLNNQRSLNFIQLFKVKFAVSLKIDKLILSNASTVNAGSAMSYLAHQQQQQYFAQQQAQTYYSGPPPAPYMPFPMPVHGVPWMPPQPSYQGYPPPGGGVYFPHNQQLPYRGGYPPTFY